MLRSKIDKGMIFGKNLARNERKFGKKGSTEPQGYFGQKPSQAAELAVKKGEEHKAKRGVKKVKGMKEEVKRDEYGDPMGEIQRSPRSRKQRILHQILLMSSIPQQPLRVLHMVCLRVRKTIWSNGSIW